VVGKGGRDFSTVELEFDVADVCSMDELRIPNACEARPADVCSIGKEVKKILSFCKLLQIRRTADTRFKEG
jgi:hypothetical protein